jgi:hypothetical protein
MEPKEEWNYVTFKKMEIIKLSKISQIQKKNTAFFSYMWVVAIKNTWKSNGNYLGVKVLVGRQGW